MSLAIQVTFDCADPAALSRFWSEVLGYRLDSPPPPLRVVGGGARCLEHPGGEPQRRVGPPSTRRAPGPRLFFQKVPEGKSGEEPRAPRRPRRPRARGRRADGGARGQVRGARRPRRDQAAPVGARAAAWRQAPSSCRTPRATSSASTEIPTSVVSRLVAGAPRTSTTDCSVVECEGRQGLSLETMLRYGRWFRGSSLALLAPQPPTVRWLRCEGRQGLSLETMLRYGRWFRGSSLALLAPQPPTVRWLRCEGRQGLSLETTQRERFRRRPAARHPGGSACRR